MIYKNINLNVNEKEEFEMVTQKRGKDLLN